MKNRNILQIINSINIVTNATFIALALLIFSVNPYALVILIMFGFPVAVILAIISLITNIIYQANNRIVGAFNIKLAIASATISIVWFVIFGYFISNIGF